ncbi:MAG: hypothetical protein H6713_24465 [Myxococcales bacterium]|nr:hypothetical protein [Myxococcales bacterium]MCB9753122.1 hypothetical protein [Myxococcales bacterium]
MASAPASIGHEEQAASVIRSMPALRAHVQAPTKARDYRRLMQDIGVDPDALGVLELHPMVIYAEQPGSWLYPEDLLRLELLDRLIASGGFHPRSGPMTLLNDGFSSSGNKAYFTQLHLLPGLCPLRLIGAENARVYRRYAYDRIPLRGSIEARVRDVMTEVIELLRAATRGPDEFAQWARQRLLAGLPPWLRPVFPGDNQKRALLELGARLHAHDTGQAAALLASLALEGQAHATWASYWITVGGRLAGRPVALLDAIFNRMVLAMERPVVAARALARWSGRGGVVPLTGAVDEDGRFCLIFCDPASGALRWDGHGAITWPQVRAMAEEGRTGGPSVILEYLMMAALGIYVIGDRHDGQTAFERCAQAVHERYLGLPWPLIIFPGPRVDTPEGILEVFGDRHRREREIVFSGFFT